MVSLRFCISYLFSYSDACMYRVLKGLYCIYKNLLTSHFFMWASSNEIKNINKYFQLSTLTIHLNGMIE